MASAALRIGTVLLLLAALCTGCMGSGEQKEPARNGKRGFLATAGYLDSALAELGEHDFLNSPVFADGYSCQMVGDTVFYWANHWYGPHQIASVILAENQTTGEILPVDLGCWQRVGIREIRETADPTEVRIFFSDGIIYDGSEYYTRSFVESVDYSLIKETVTAENSLCVPGQYGMVGDSVEYRQNFRDCAVIRKRIALRFSVTQTTGWEGCPKSTKVVLPESFVPGEPGEILLPRVDSALPVEFLAACAKAEGIASVAAEPMGPEGGTRLIITPGPEYTPACGFDTPNSTDWGETLWVWGEKG